MEILDHLQKQNWIFAYKMGRHPHWYSVREQWGDDASFDMVVTHIRLNGFDRYFFKKKLRYFQIGDYEYWTMGAPLAETIILNRAYVGRMLDFSIDCASTSLRGFADSYIKTVDGEIERNDREVSEFAVLEALRRVRGGFPHEPATANYVKMCASYLLRLGILLSPHVIPARKVHSVIEKSEASDFKRAIQLVVSIAGKPTAERIKMVGPEL